MESRNHIELRTFQEKDFAEVLQLFYDTVRNINSRDYTPEQISAWILGVDEARMKKALLAHTTLVATSNGKIAGFADMDESASEAGNSHDALRCAGNRNPGSCTFCACVYNCKGFFSAARLSAASRTAGGTSGTASDKLSHGKKEKHSLFFEIGQAVVIFLMVS